MFYPGVRSNTEPSAVQVEVLGDGSKHVRLADNIQEIEEDGQTLYQYDEAVFDLEAFREETAEDIEEEFEGWWEYGTQPEEPLPTLEERVAAIEDFLIGGEL